MSQSLMSAIIYVLKVTKLDISTILPKFVLGHLDTDNILTDSTKITEFAEKRIQQTSTPAAKYKEIQN